MTYDKVITRFCCDNEKQAFKYWLKEERKLCKECRKEKMKRVTERSWNWTELNVENVKKIVV